MNLPAGTAPYMILYLVTLVAHVVLISYVLVGAGWLAVTGLLGRADDRIAATFRDWLPFALGAAITAGVAPLLFVQVLYQERFYTASLLMSHRWMAVIPALIIGFYALYVAKSARAQTWTPRWRAAAASVAALCFVFVALSWTEQHLLQLREDRWAPMYGAGTMMHTETALVPRLLLWLFMALPIAATVLAWQVADDRAALRTLRNLVLVGLVGALLWGGWLHSSLSTAQRTFLIDGVGSPAAALGALAALGLAGSWLLVPRGTGLRRLIAPSLLMLIAVGAGAVLRERLRVHTLAPVRERVAEAGGFAWFLVFFVINAVVIGWCIHTARRHLIK